MTPPLQLIESIIKGFGSTRSGGLKKDEVISEEGNIGGGREWGCD